MSAAAPRRRRRMEWDHSGRVAVHDRPTQGLALYIGGGASAGAMLRANKKRSGRFWGHDPACRLDNLFRSGSVWNRGPAAKRLITEGRLPVPGDDELGTIQELHSTQKSPG